jgi:anti-sigma B factor antagonist
MEVTSQAFRDVELVSLNGRMDSMGAPMLAKALEAANYGGRYKIIVDMSQLEYMSSAGFRALGDAQSKSKYHHGEVVLTQVPDLIHSALELVGFAEYFKVFDNLTAAFDHMDNLSDDESPADTWTSSSEN